MLLLADLIPFPLTRGHCEKIMGKKAALGHSRPMHLVPVPINVRCYSNSNPIVRRSE
jgi:hypothetical protein